MEKVAIDQLGLVDLHGRPVNLQDYFQEYSLLNFSQAPRLTAVPTSPRRGEISQR